MKVENRADWIAEKVRGQEVLDVGACGFSWRNDPNWLKNDWFHYVIQKEARTVVGIDIYREGIRKARELGFNIIYGNAEHYISDKKFDIVFAGNTIEHLYNPGLFLKCTRKNLKKDGKLILTTPNARHPNQWLTMKGSRPDHVHLYDPLTIGNLLRKHGFSAEIHYLKGSPRTLKGKIYVNLFLHVFPKYSCSLGVVAEVKK